MNAARLKLRLPWKTRRGLVVWIASGFLVPTLYLAWHIFGWPEPIRISYETTRLTEPLTEDGYVDYLKYFRDQLKLNGNDYVNDPWLALLRNEEEARLPARVHQKRPQPPGTSGIVYREPSEFFREMLDEDPASVTGYERLGVYETEVMERRLRLPFSTVDDPAAATAIAANADWYRAIEQSCRATPLPVKFPVRAEPRSQQTAGNIQLDIHQYGHQIKKRFCLRSMHRAGEGDLSGALSDIDFLFRMAARMDGCCLVSTLSACSIERSASQAAIIQVLTDIHLRNQHCARIEALPQVSTFDEMIRLADTNERFVRLDVIQGSHAGRGRLEALMPFYFSGKLAYAKSRRFWHAVDWNRVFREVNVRHDACVAAARQPTWKLQKLALAKAEHLNIPSGNLNVDLDDIPPWSSFDPTDWLIAYDARRSVNLSHVLVETHNRDLYRRAVQIIARLAMWRQVHGRFPEQLSSVLEVEGFTKALPELLWDPFANTELAYSSSDEGFVLSSVGPNMVKDQATTSHEADDCVWRWPAE